MKDFEETLAVQQPTTPRIKFAHQSCTVVLARHTGVHLLADSFEECVLRLRCPVEEHALRLTLLPWVQLQGIDDITHVLAGAAHAGARHTVQSIHKCIGVRFDELTLRLASHMRRVAMRVCVWPARLLLAVRQAFHRAAPLFRFYTAWGLLR